MQGVPAIHILTPVRHLQRVLPAGQVVVVGKTKFDKKRDGDFVVG